MIADATRIIIHVYYCAKGNFIATSIFGPELRRQELKEHPEVIYLGEL
jgi:hypothetical protein